MTHLTAKPGKQKNILLLLPVFGTIAFVVLYFIATLFYPGGSQSDKDSVGFSWISNYWCNLLNENAINGQHNPARPIAMTGMFILCLFLSLFWFLFPKYSNTGKPTSYIIQIAGILTMCNTSLLLTGMYHDLVINTAGLFGLITLACIFTRLYQLKWYGLFVFGMINLLLVGLNNYFYYTKGLIIYLPVIQKISFGSFLIWICCIDIQLYNIATDFKIKKSTTR
jgi:hypothetical protein